MRALKTSQLIKKTVSAVLTAAMLITGLPVDSNVVKKAKAADDYTYTPALFNDGTYKYALKYEYPKYFGQSVDFTLVREDLTVESGEEEWVNVTDEVGENYYLSFYYDYDGDLIKSVYDTTADMTLDALWYDESKQYYIYVDGLANTKNYYIGTSNRNYAVGGNDNINLFSAINDNDNIVCPIESITYSAKTGDEIVINEEFALDHLKYNSFVTSADMDKFTVKANTTDEESFIVTDNDINTTYDLQILVSDVEVYSGSVPVYIKVKQEFDEFLKLFGDDDYDYYMAYKKNMLIGNNFHYNYVYVDKGEKITADNYTKATNIANNYSIKILINNEEYEMADEDALSAYYFSKSLNGDLITPYSKVPAEYVFDNGEKTYDIEISDNDDNSISNTKVTVNWESPAKYEDSVDYKLHMKNDEEITLKCEKYDWTNTSVNWRSETSIFGMSKKNTSDDDSNWVLLQSVSSPVGKTNNDYSLDETPGDYRYFMINSEFYTTYNGYNYIMGAGHRKDYEVSGVPCSPVRFYDINNKCFKTEVSESFGVSNYAKSYTIKPEISVLDGYDVKYQWKTYIYGSGYNNIDGATEPEYTAEKFDETYCLFADAYIEGTDEKVSTSVYKADFNNPPVSEYFKIKTSSTWNYMGGLQTAFCGIGETINPHLDVEINDGYTAEYMWYKSAYVDEEEDYDSSQYLACYDKNIYFKYEEMGIKTTSMNYEFTAKDFSYDNNGEMEYRPVNFMLEVLIKDSEGEQVGKYYLKLKVDEDCGIKNYIYSEDETPKKITYDGTGDLKITAPIFEVLPAYDVIYKWYRNDDEGFRVKLEGDNRTLTLSAEDDIANFYYCTITIVRKDKEYPIVNPDKAVVDEEINMYTVLKDTKDVNMDVYRTTRVNNKVKLKESAQMGVEAVAEAQDALISYKWYHDGKVLENQNEKDLTLENVSSDDFGTY
nr:hypothetical protein [Lachnospiraceae bacterium]